MKKFFFLMFYDPFKGGLCPLPKRRGGRERKNGNICPLIT